MAYIQNVVMNTHFYKDECLNGEEFDILFKWHAKKFIILLPCNGISIIKQFWDSMNELLWLGYVNIDFS
jgi:hypothetical protein